MSNANRVKLAFVEEETFGVTRTNANLQILRYNSESLKHDIATTISEELRSDRQISDIVRTGVSASGDISFELSYGSHDELLKAALLASSWEAEKRVRVATTVSASATDNSINDSASGFSGFSAHKWIYVSGFLNSANNGFFKILTATTAKLVLATGTLITEAAHEAVTVQMGAQITNGSTLNSYNIEKTYEDLTEVIALFQGMCINTLSLEVPADGIITGSIGFVGSKETPLTESAGLGYIDETTSVVMTGANHVPEIFENLEDIAILSLSLSLGNNLRQRMQVGTLGVTSIGIGSVDVTGSVTINLANATLYNKYLNQTVTSIAMAFRDTVGNGYVLELPSVKITSGTRQAGGINTDVVGEFELRAYMDSTEGITIRIAKFPVADTFVSSVVGLAAVAGAMTVV